jgi:hypothetical protein
VLFLARHFAEGAGLPGRQENRIVAKAFVAARRPYDRTVDAGFEFFDMSVRPGDAQSRDEMRVALRSRGSAAILKLLLDRFHGTAKILIRSGPACRINARGVIERIDHKTGIVGEGRQAACHRGGLGLDPRVGAKARSGFVGFGKAHLAC